MIQGYNNEVIDPVWRETVEIVDYYTENCSALHMEEPAGATPKWTIFLEYVAVGQAKISKLYSQGQCPTNEMYSLWINAMTTPYNQYNDIYGYPDTSTQFAASTTGTDMPDASADTFQSLASDIDNLYIGIMSAESSPQTDWNAQLKVNNKPLNLKIDTGAQCNVLSEGTLHSIGIKHVWNLAELPSHRLEEANSELKEKLTWMSNTRILCIVWAFSGCQGTNNKYSRLQRKAINSA